MVLLLETKPQGDNAEVCYQPLMPWHGQECVCVSECVSCFISAQRCKGAWPYHGVSASSCIPPSPPGLEIVNTNTHTHTHTHTRTKQIRGNAPKLFNTSVSGSLWKRGVPVSVWWPGQTADIDELLDANVIVPPLTCVLLESRGAVTCTGSAVSWGCEDRAISVAENHDPVTRDNAQTLLLAVSCRNFFFFPRPWVDAFSGRYFCEETSPLNISFAVLSTESRVLSRHKGIVRLGCDSPSIKYLKHSASPICCITVDGGWMSSVCLSVCISGTVVLFVEFHSVGFYWRPC